MFDFDSQAGITQVLASIRASELSSEEKGELRDLVFLYATGGHDAGVKHTLEQKLQHYAVVAVAASAPVTASQPPVAHPFGTSRSAPEFVTPKVVPPTATKPAPSEPAPAPETPTPTTPDSTTAPTQSPVKSASPVTPSPAPTPDPVNSPASTPTKTPPPAPDPAPTPDASVAPAPSNYNPDTTLARIREIKSLVNDKVGNPVNLVDIDNAIGREYMSALLDAMKKVNNGSAAQAAMSRLEAAFTAVNTVIANYKAEESTRDTPNTPNTPSAPSAPSATPAVTAPAAPIQNPASSPARVPTQPTVQPTAPSTPATPARQPEQLTQPPQPTAVQRSETTAAPDVATKVVPAQAVSQPKTIPTEKPHTVAPASSPQSAAGSQSTPVPPPVPVAAPVSAPVPTPTTPTPTTPTPPVSATPATTAQSSLANSKVKLQTPDVLPDPASLETSSTGDNLHTAEVDNGLELLLVEWPIFKKSGLFGTGPKGREHPLFKQIAGLQIPLLLSGRFEGATQEIKQSITDYMNGWRYEQGIIYQEGETFEQYLRRVIRHIIDLHKS